MPIEILAGPEFGMVVGVRVAAGGKPERSKDGEPSDHPAPPVLYGLINGRALFPKLARLFLHANLDRDLDLVDLV